MKKRKKFLNALPSRCMGRLQLGLHLPSVKPYQFGPMSQIFKRIFMKSEKNNNYNCEKVQLRENA